MINAIKYSPNATSIEFTNYLGKEVTLSIKDLGLGIPANDQPHLFERFFRASNVTAIQGTRFGLNIVISYVNLLNGQLEYHSEEYAGSEFIIRLPVNSITN